MERDRFYLNPETLDRVLATYRVHLTIRAIHDAYVDIEATSDSQATELALGREVRNVDWTYDVGDRDAIEACCVECEDPPKDSILIQQGYCKCGANLNAIFEPETPEKTGEAASDGE
jgi:hypothetical protein